MHALLYELEIHHEGNYVHTSSSYVLTEDMLIGLRIKNGEVLVNLRSTWKTLAAATPYLGNSCYSSQYHRRRCQASALLPP